MTATFNYTDHQEACHHRKRNPSMERRKGRRLEKDQQADLGAASSPVLEGNSGSILDRGQSTDLE